MIGLFCDHNMPIICCGFCVHTHITLGDFYYFSIKQRGRLSCEPIASAYIWPACITVSWYMYILALSQVQRPDIGPVGTWVLGHKDHDTYMAENAHSCKALDPILVWKIHIVLVWKCILLVDIKAVRKYST